MAQDATNLIPPKGLWTLKIKDFVTGAAVATIPQLIALLDFWNSSDHWPSYAEWLPYLKMTVYTFAIYILKNLSTNNVGQLFTRDKPLVTVNKEHLDQLTEQAKTN